MDQSGVDRHGRDVRGKTSAKIADPSGNVIELKSPEGGTRRNDLCVQTVATGVSGQPTAPCSGSAR